MKHLNWIIYRQSRVECGESRRRRNRNEIAMKNSNGKRIKKYLFTDKILSKSHMEVRKVEAVAQVMRSNLVIKNLLLSDFNQYILVKVYILWKSQLFFTYFKSISYPFFHFNDTYFRIWVFQGQEIHLLCFLGIALGTVNEGVK